MKYGYTANSQLYVAETLRFQYVDCASGLGR